MKNSIKKLFSEILAVLLIVQPISPVFAQGIAEETTQKIVFYENSAEEQSKENAEIKDSAVLREQDKQAVPEENKEEEAKENPATENQEEQPAFEQSVNIDGMQITVKADEGVFADADRINARKVTGKEEEKINEAIEQEHSDNDRMTKSYTFDIKVFDSKGNELQPNNEKGGVYVSFLPVDTEQEALNKGNIEVSVYHTNSEEMDTLQNEDSLQVTKLNVDVNTETAKGTTVVTAKTDGFSYYTVEFTYGEKQYVLNGDSSTKLTEILKHVGISLKSGNESITKAESSEPELFSVSKNTDGEWIVSALKAFSVTEKLTVEADGISYEIAVTDSQHPLTVTGGTEGVDYEWRNYAYFMNGDDVVQYPVLRKYMLHILSSKALVIEGDATQFKVADGTPDGKGGAIVIPEGVEANLTLKNTKIRPSDWIPPMSVMKDAECKLTLEGENTLLPRIIFKPVGQGAKFTVPAVWVPEGAKLTVTQASTGVLTAESAYENAIIGGWNAHQSGDITIDGGILKLENHGALESRTNVSGPCIGGYNNCGNITINGGKIEATCVQSAPIGLSYNPTPYIDAKGKVTVNGGTIVTKHQTRDGAYPYYADGIGDTQHKTAVDVRINGGNVDTDFDRTRPKNDTHDGLVNGVYRVKITLLGAGEGQEITSYTMFNGKTVYLQDTKTLPNGELYLWLLPFQDQIITSVHCGGQDYTGVVKAVDNDTDAQAVFRRDTTGTGTLTASMKAEHVQGVKLNHTTGLSAGDTVALSFDGAESGYLLKGMCLYTGTTLPPAPREVSSDFTKLADKLYSFKMPAENVTVYLNAPKIRTVSAGEQTHIASVSFNPTDNLTVGDTVKLSYATEAGWKVTGMALRKATDTPTNPQDISSDFTKLSEGNYQFTMPDYDVCVDFKCEEKAASGAEAGDFIISDANCSYSFDTTSRTLTLSGGGRATISMKSGVSSTSDCIAIAAGSNINLTIKNLTVSAPKQGVSGLTFPDHIGGVCRLILEGTNQFTSNQKDTPAVRKRTRGQLIISGKGKLIAIATGTNSNGIGSGNCGNLYIEGGTIYAEASHDNMAIGHANNGAISAVYYTGGTVEGICEGAQFYGGLTGKDADVIITGGSLHSVHWGYTPQVHTPPTNGSVRVYLTTITLGEGATLAKQAYVTAPLVGAGNYGINQMHTDDEGKLYLWLPENTTVTKVETDKGIYQGSVTTNTANYFGTANAVFTLAEKQEGSGSVAIEGWTYGENAKAPVPTSTTNGTANVSYTYFTDEACTTKTTSDNSGADSIGSVPKNVGSYWVQATFAETPRYKAFTAKVGFAISKATVSFTPPTPKTGLTYTGETQELINAGTVDASIGKLTYSLSETGTYSETIPRAQDAGTYRVYYQVIGTNANYDYTNAKGDIEVSIGKVSITPTVAISGWTYGASPNAPTLTGNTGGGAVTYDYFTDEACTTKTTAANGGAESTGGVPKNAGKYWVKATIAETANYTAATAKATFAIKKAEVSFTPPNPKTDLSYTGELQELINAGSVDSNIGKMQYSLSETGTYSETIPTAKDVGSYSVYYKVVGTNANYDYSNAKGSVDVLIHEVYEVKVVDGMGTGKYREDQIVTIKADEKSGYTFIGWTSDVGVVFDNASAKETSFVMPAKAVKVTANYRSNSSGGSSGGGSGGSGGSNTSKDDGSIIIKTEKAPDLPTTAEIIVKAKKGNDKTATAEISEKTVENAIKKAKEEAKKKGKESNGIAIEINIAMPRGTDKVKMNLSENTLGKMVSGEVKHLTVNGSFVKVVFDKNAVFGIKKQSKGDVSVTIIPMKKLSKEPKKLIGNRPVYDISLSNGNGKKITDFGNGTATVLLSYKLEKTETIGGLYAVYVDEKERAFRIDPSAYDVNSGSVIFATNHLSVYGVGYTAPSQRFDDTKKHWAKDFIDYVVGRGLLDGSRENKFYPNEKMTRGMLVTALGKLAGVNVKKYETNSFTDVQNDSSYHPYIEWAYSKGVVYGIGDGTFAPDKSITREEMAVIFERYAKVMGCKIPVTREASVYEDKEQIGTEYRESVKAMQQAGIMMGIDGNKFNPKGNATRAEVSAMLSRYIKLTITPETAQGFVLDDAGKYHYYKDGKALTGKQTLDGTVYFFDESGVLQIGWVKDGNIWRYYDGTKAHKGWLNLKVEGEERIYYLNREGLLESGKWVKIDGKWYYFYPDGTLAVNTEIDGYKVDGKGVRKEK